MSESTRGAPNPSTTSSRTHLVSAALGVWLACSAVLWPQPRAHQLNALTTGAVIFVASLLAASHRRVRPVVTVAAVWLLLSGWVLPVAPPPTFWNALIVAFAVFFTSLFAPEARRGGGSGRSAGLPRPGGLAR